MSLLDSVLSEVGGNLDVGGIADRLGIDPATAEKAITALGVAHPQPGDTVETASAQTGIDTSTLSQIVDQIGGASALSQLSEGLQNHPQAASLFGMLDRDGDGNPVNDVMGMAKGLFGSSQS